MSQYVLNAASLCPQETDFAAGRELAIRLIQILAEHDIQIGGAAWPLKLPRHAWDLIIACGDDGCELSLGNCVNDLYASPETHEFAVFFDALQQHAPSVDQLDDSTIEAILRLTPSAPVQGFEAHYDAVCAADCDAMQCAVTGGTLVSLDLPLWDFDQAALMCDETRVELDHASRIPHVDAIVARLHDAVYESLTQRNFNALRARAFPHLVWGKDVSDQIAAFPAEYLPLCFKRLANLDSIVRKWRANGDYLPDSAGVEFKAESDLTMQNYGDARRFRSANGAIRTYERHINVSRGTRIHMLIESETRSIEIGYIGVHLPTWRFN